MPKDCTRKLWPVRSRTLLALTTPTSRRSRRSCTFIRIGKHREKPFNESQLRWVSSVSFLCLVQRIYRNVDVEGASQLAITGNGAQAVIARRAERYFGLHGHGFSVNALAHDIGFKAHFS